MKYYFCKLLYEPCNIDLVNEKVKKPLHAERHGSMRKLPTKGIAACICHLVYRAWPTLQGTSMRVPPPSARYLHATCTENPFPGSLLGQRNIITYISIDRNVDLPER